MRTITSCEDIPARMPVYIYGTGTAGRTIFARINAKRNGIVQGFVDSSTRGEINGLPILNPVADRDVLSNAAILIASQAWVEIRHRLEKLGFANIFNAYPLFTAPADIKLDDGFGSPALRAELIDQITRSPETARFAIVGSGRSASGLAAALLGSEVSAKISQHYDITVHNSDDRITPINPMFNDHLAGKFDAIVLAVPVSDIRTAIRRVRIIQGVNAPIWLPKQHLDAASLPTPIKTRKGTHLVEIRDELTERHGDPILVIVPPCAGTMRFLPQIEYLLSLTGWTPKPFMPLTWNPFFFSRFRGGTGKPPADAETIAACYRRENTEAYYWFSKSLRHNEYTVLHDHSIDFGRFADLPHKVVVLMRDPRDIFNSIFYRNYSHEIDSRSPEEFMLDLLDGENFFSSPEYGYRWGSAKEWADGYLTALESDNMEVVRFEELHRDEIGTLRTLLSRLGLFPTPFIDITEDTLRFAAHLGSFEHQTNGQASRGEERQRVVGESSCRKGVVGDWRSTFTPAVVDKFKRLTGDALIRLGYETSMDWGMEQRERLW